MEPLAVVGAELLEADGVAAQVPADHREALVDRRKFDDAGERISERRRQAAVVVGNRRADPVVAIEGIGDIGAD